MIVEPPRAVGALHDKSTVVLPTVDVGAAGVPGASVGVTETDEVSAPYEVFFAFTVTA